MWVQTGQYLIAVQQFECPIDDPPATGGIEDIQEFRFDALLKIGACPLGRADRAELQPGNYVGQYTSWLSPSVWFSWLCPLGG